MPDRAAALLDATAGTPDEMTAFQALAPALQACAPQRAELHIKPGNVRWLVAMSLDRLAQPRT